MAKLTGQTIAASYDQLLIVGDANGITATAQAVESADTGGNASLLYLSTTEVYNPGTGGTSNTAFGKNAGDALDSGGNYNVFLGEEAGSAMATGTNNIAIGFGAFDAADAGEDDNIAIGLNALGDANHASTVRNIAIGSGAMDYIAGIQGANQDNIFIGHDAGGGQWATAVSQYNIGIGSYAMDDAMYGALYNTGIGYAALGALTQGDQNTVVGYQAGDAINTGSWNILMGVNTGGSITTGGENTFLGSGAGASLTTGTTNIAVGSGSLDAAAVGESGNVAIGQNAMGAVDEGSNAGSDTVSADHNVAIGYQALLGGDMGDASSSSGAHRDFGGNIAIGAYALDATATNPMNGTVAIGHQSLTALTGAGNNGHHNVAIGYQAASALTIGQRNVAIGYGAFIAGAAECNDNVAIGYQALDNTGTTLTAACIAIGGSTLTEAAHANVTGSIAIGHYALNKITSADRNTAIGYLALRNNDTGGNNTVIGYNAMADTEAVSASEHNTFMGVNAGGGTWATSVCTSNVGIGNYTLDGAMEGASSNTAVGYRGLSAITTGAANVGIGKDAGLVLDTGGTNTFIGVSAGDGTDDGSNNVAVGYLALSANCADTNTAVGVEALIACTGGTNTAVGSAAGYSVTSGANNTFLGFQSGISGSPGGAQSTGNSKIFLGDENITNFHAQVALSVASDKRDKTDVKELDLGLEFINKLLPVTYKWDKRSKYIDKHDPTVDLNEVVTDGTHKEDWIDVGFLAQDVADIESSYDYKIKEKTNLTTSLSDDGKQYSTQYSKFVPMLVKSIQELSQKVDEQSKRIEELESK